MAALTTGNLSAEGLNWNYKPNKVGNLLVGEGGGWGVEYRLGIIDASPEFSFPLQLVYQNNRQSRGLFGSQWYCPQLESSLIPEGRDILIWTMPSGRQVAFQSNPKAAGHLIGLDGHWKGMMYGGGDYHLMSEEGWTYAYSRGKLTWVESPAERIIQFDGVGTGDVSIIFRDSATGSRRILATYKTGENRCIAAMTIQGVVHRFGYKTDHEEERLVGWTPPVGYPLAFEYQPDHGILEKIDTLSGTNILESFFFKSLYVVPEKVSGGNPERKPANYRLQSDDVYDYPGGGEPGQVSAVSKSGMTISATSNPRRGIETTSINGVVTTTYYYIAPGEKYDGKLRRVEKDGVLQIECQYDRVKGTLSQSVDQNGTITTYEYPRNWPPSRVPLLPPKPSRILQSHGSESPKMISEFEYDDWGKPTLVRNALGQTTRYSYTRQGEVASITTADGGVTLFNYDSFGRRTSVSRNGVKESVAFDDFGRVKTRVGADGVATEYNYNEQGALSSLTKGGKLLAEYLNDEHGGLIGIKDGLGRIQKLSYDNKGHLLSVTAPNGSVTRYEYDKHGNRTAQIDGNGNRITFSYDPCGHLIKEITPLGETLSWNYNARGQLISHSNGENNITQSYDELGRLTKVDYGKPAGDPNKGSPQSISYSYDHEGRLLRAQTPETQTLYSYDPLGRMQNVTLIQGPTTNSSITLLRYRYNAEGCRTSLLLAESKPTNTNPPSGSNTNVTSYEPMEQIDYSYDPAGRLGSISCNGAPVVSYRYDAGGHPIQKSFGNGMNESLAYDAMGRLVKVSFSGGNISIHGSEAAAPAGGGSSVAAAPPPMNPKESLPSASTGTNPPSGLALDLLYQWDDASQITSRSWHGQRLLYEYDPAGQLISVKDAGSNQSLESYNYDMAGNMITKMVSGRKTSMIYDAANQLIGTEEEHVTLTAAAPASQGTPAAVAESSPSAGKPPSFTYDVAGRLIKSLEGATRSYGWIDKVVNLLTPSGEKFHYTYWPDGQLASKEGAQGTPPERYLWDGLALLRRGDTLYIIEPHPSGGVPIASYIIGKPEEMTWYLNDLLGTTLATLDEEGVHYQQMTSFGQPLQMTASAQKTSCPIIPPSGGTPPPSPAAPLKLPL